MSEMHVCQKALEDLVVCSGEETRMLKARYLTEHSHRRSETAVGVTLMVVGCNMWQ